jgi:FtsZ-interacting cell division protein YlmF
LTGKNESKKKSVDSLSRFVRKSSITRERRERERERERERDERNKNEKNTKNNNNRIVVFSIVVVAKRTMMMMVFYARVYSEAREANERDLRFCVFSLE